MTAPRPLHTIAGPKGLPLIGNAHQIRNEQFHAQLESWAREWGPVYSFAIGARKFLCITQSDAIESVLRRRPAVFRRSSRLDQIASDTRFVGVFSANGDTWRRQRPMVTAGLDPTHVRAFMPVLSEVTGALRQRWETAAQDGQEIDLLADLMRFTVDVTTSLAFGQNLHTLEETDDTHLIQQHLNVIFPMMLRRLLAPVDVEHWMVRKETRLHLEALRKAVLGFIDRARAELRADPELRSRPRNLLQAMLVACESETGITEDDLVGNVFTILLAGEDTTASTVAWLLWLLHQHPDKLQQARAEALAVLGEDPQASRWEQLQAMEFIQACAQETLRLKPVAPLIINEANEDAVVADVLVPKGSFVMCVMRPAGLDAREIVDAASFSPGRWVDQGAMAAAARHATMPFGSGPRICPGRYLALAEIKAVASMILTRFDLDDLATNSPTEKFTFVMAPVGLRSRPRVRQSAAASRQPQALA
ncbi:cytochrome P450 [Ramlibacter sp. AN1015]|uniref:cytochrome P450 n=1 Tax=Ramlibacter sp. AN1015 TaxID=3133428 RepID=UPI0030BE8DC4